MIFLKVSLNLILLFFKNKTSIINTTMHIFSNKRHSLSTIRDARRPEVLDLLRTALSATDIKNRNHCLRRCIPRTQCINKVPRAYQINHAWIPIRKFQLPD